MAVGGIKLNFMSYKAMTSAYKDAAQPVRENNMLLDGSAWHRAGLHQLQRHDQRSSYALRQLGRLQVSLSIAVLPTRR